MVYTPTLFAVAIPEDLAVDLRAMAEGTGITPEALILSILRGRVKDWRGQHRDMLPPVPSYTPPPVRPVTPLARYIADVAEDAASRLAGRPSSPRDAVWRAVVNLGEADAHGVRDEIDRLMGFAGYVPIETIRTILSQLAHGGALRRLQPGVYGPTRED